MIQLTCPGCGEELEIDDGFEGGVCRCSECGRMISVGQEAPKEPEVQEWTEQDQEDSQAPADETPTGRPQEQDSVRFDRQRRRRDGVGGRQEEAQAARPAGRKKGSTLSAQERKRIHRKVMLGFWGIVVVIVVVAGVGLWYLSEYMKDRQLTAPVGPTVEVVPNPFLIKTPGFFGIEVKESVVLVVDSSAPVTKMFSAVKQGILAGHRTLEGRSFMVIFMAEDGVVKVPPTLTVASQIKTTDLAQKLEGVIAEGNSAAQAAIDEAIKQKPKQIIIIAKNLGPDEVVESIRRSLAAVQLPVHVVMLDRSNDTLKSLSGSTQGSYREFNPAEFDGWYKEFYAKNGGAITGEAAPQ